MKRKRASFEFIYQLTALVVIVILVHLAYSWVIRPRAENWLQQERELKAEDSSVEMARSYAVIIKDSEQEACTILFLWALAIMGLKASTTTRHAKLLDQKFANLSEGQRILPADARDMVRSVQALPETQRSALLPRAWLAALHRFEATHNVQDVSETVGSACDGEGERLESELSMIRYIAWAIPSIGFIGTVRGIGMALSKAEAAVEGNIAPVTQSLGVAFNSTFLALILSILLMFFVHQLQLMQERYVLDVRDYCEQNLVRFLHVKRDGGASV